MAAGRPSLTWHRLLSTGLQDSVRGNAQAFGFSITVTVTFGVVSHLEHEPRLTDLFLFAMASVTAFSLLNLFVAVRLPNTAESKPGERATLVGTATDFLAVGGAVGAAIGIGELVDGTLAWVLPPFVAGMVYVAVQAVELAVGREEAEDDEPASP